MNVDSFAADDDGADPTFRLLDLSTARRAKSCDPAPNPYHIMEFSKDDGRVSVRFAWTWDGISIHPDCAGSLFGVNARNTGQQTWYAHFKGKRGQPRVIAVTPGMDETRGAAWLSQRGLDSLDDLSAFALTLSSEPPVSGG